MAHRNRILSGLALAALLALLIAPQTRWILGVQVGSALHIVHPFNRIFDDEMGSPDPAAYTGFPEFDNERVQGVLKREAHNFPVQMAYALPLSSGAINARVEMRELIPRFPNSPSLYANLLRCEASGHIILNRPEIDLLDGERNPDHSFEHVSTSNELARYDQEAAAGERLDPDNAYFPFMRSVGLFAAHRDNEGLAAIQRASIKPQWNDYSMEETHGHWQLHREAFGDRNAITQAAYSAALLLPQYTPLRQSAYFAVSKAIRMEQKGDRQRGLAVREALMPVGGLMRIHSSMNIGSIVGIEVASIATLRPVSIRLNAPQRIELYCNYLHQIKHPSEEREAQAEYSAGRSVRHILGLDQKTFAYDDPPNPVLAQGPFGNLPNLIVWWMTDVSLLSNLLWVLLLRLLASRLAHRIGNGQPLTRRFRLGSLFLSRWGLSLLDISLFGNPMCSRTYLTECEIKILLNFSPGRKLLLV